MTTTVKLPPELEQSLRQRCAAEGRSISDVMRDALLAYLASAPTGTASAWSSLGGLQPVLDVTSAPTKKR